jgi:hypothetical protein
MRTREDAGDGRANPKGRVVGLFEKQSQIGNVTLSSVRGVAVSGLYFQRTRSTDRPDRAPVRTDSKATSRSDPAKALRFRRQRRQTQ